ncbi:MAG: dTMP kinase [candidate division Zixibacteria bacterium]
MTKKNKPRGQLITFEGIDGSGKSVQARKAYNYLKKLKKEVILLREPGSTPVAEKLRKILLDKKLAIPDLTELLLYEAARSELTALKIKPALASGAVVLCDRFYDSTTAYQGYGRRLDIKMVKALHKIATGNIVPDLTFVFDVDLNTAAKRRGKTLDRLESQSLAFHSRVRKGFQKIALDERRRVKLIDSFPLPDLIFEQVRTILNRKLKLQ